MTNEEALAHFKNHKYMTDFSWQDEMSKIAIEALEKQIAKTVKYDEYGREEGYPHCPDCRKTLINDFVGATYCIDCGQKILWEGENE